MKFLLKLSLVLCLLATVSCKDKDIKLIGVSQCSSDEWRDQMNSEMKREAFLHPELHLEFRSSDDDSQKQIEDIEYFISKKVDLLIISPNEETTLIPIVEKAYTAGIPVVLVDRKVDTDKYTAYIGGDNLEVGRQAAEYISDHLPCGGNLIIIEGLEKSSASKERKAAFLHGIASNPKIKIVADIVADWQRDKARSMMDTLDLGGKKIDALFAFNDRMAIGAWESLRQNEILYVGVDALMDESVGLSKISDGILDASFLYPTGGDKAIHIAWSILNNQPYEKETILQTGLVNQSNVHMIRLQSIHISELDQKIELLNGKLNDFLQLYTTQRKFLLILFVLMVVLLVMSEVIYLAYRSNAKLNGKLKKQKEILERQRDELAEQKEMVERQRDLLEEERDKQIEARLATEQNREEEATATIEDGFYKRLIQIVDDNMDNTALSVDVLGAEVNLGRVQLYRKCKASCGLSPNELIRTQRLNRAYKLLHETHMNISEVAYSVGFSSPSYFAKCYKDKFGKNPTDSQKY